MGYGYALLPTAEEMTSTLSFRLSPSEKKERDAWIRGAFSHGLNIVDIAYDVGLSEQRVKQILKEDTGPARPKTRPSTKRFKTPEKAALHDFEENDMHPSCRRALYNHGDICSHCWGQMNLIMSEYNANGWPYDWAMRGQEKYIAQCR